MFTGFVTVTKFSEGDNGCAMVVRAVEMSMLLSSNILEFPYHELIGTLKVY